MEKSIDRWKSWTSAGVLLCCLVLSAALWKGYLDGKFNSVEALQGYIAGFGILAPATLIMVQAGQVVVPVLPGFVGCAAGAALFGCMGGFWCNFIGISLGSILAFSLAKRYGKAIVIKMFPGKRFERWSAWAAESKSYTAILFLGMALPLFPDDFFCYFTGLTKMSAGKFMAILLLGKPWCILAYSYLFSAATELS